MVKLYPSQIRYYNEHPTVTFRLKKKQKERLQLLAEKAGKSVSELVCETLLGLVKKDLKLYEKGFDDGYNKAVLEWKVFYFCDVCGEAIYITRNSNSHKEMIGYMREHGWGHKRCFDNEQV